MVYKFWKIEKLKLMSDDIWNNLFVFEVVFFIIMKFIVVGIISSVVYWVLSEKFSICEYFYS